MSRETVNSLGPSRLALHPPPLPAQGVAAPPPPRVPADDRLLAEHRLLGRVYRRCHAFLLEACRFSSVPPEFLGALVANESGGNPRAVRFEPAVYRHLQAVATGKSPRFGGIRAADLDAELREVLCPKASAFHARYLDHAFGKAHGPELSRLEDEVLRELASSWGFTQIMGFHLLGRPGTVRDLLEPRFHFRLALELLAEFVEHYQLDVTCEFEEMFRCWNTGQPYGETFDPRYVDNGLRRLDLYRRMAREGALP